MAALFATFVNIGVVALPVWNESMSPPIETANFDTPRYRLTKAEQLLSLAVSADTANEGASRAQEALDHANNSLARRPMNPHAWQARALAHELRGDAGSALDAYRMSLRWAPYERTLAISRIDFALRHWLRLSEDGRSRVREQVVWIWPYERAEMRRLARQSPIHAGFLRASLPDVDRW